MKFTTLFTVIGAVSALGAAASPSANQGEHLALLTRKGLSNGHEGAAPMKKRHSTLKKKVKRASGYCKAKSAAVSTGNTATSSNNSNNAGSSSDDSTPTSSKQASASKTSSAAAQTSSAASDSGSSSGTASAQLGSISAFQGTNSGIMSWFRTNLGSDSTNGESWCQTKYQDDWMCFAPSVGTMLSNFGGDYSKATKAYCGREVKVTYNGKSTLAFICDGFDDKWVLSPGSIDASVALFTEVYGSFNNNKQTVAQGVQWEFTGGVVEKGTFQNGKY